MTKSIANTIDKHRHNILWVGLILLFFVIRVAGVGSDITNTDAERWHFRSRDFLTALKEGNLIETYQHYQPGVTLMWIESAVQQATFSIQYHLLKNPEPYTLNNSEAYPILHGLSKLAIVSVLTVLFAAQLYLVKKLFGYNTTKVYALLTTLEPHLIGIDRWFHLTSLETYLAFTAFLLILYKRNYKVLLLSAFLLSLSILAKVTSIIVFPLIVLALFVLMPSFKSGLKASVGYLVALTMFVFILFPALLQDPVFTISQVMEGIDKGVTWDLRSERYTGIWSFAYYPLVFIFKSLPSTLLMAGGAIFVYFKQIRQTKRVQNKSVILILMYIALYFVIFSVSVKKIDRYLIAMLPAVFLLIAVAAPKFKPKTKKRLLLAHVAFFAWAMISYFPVMSAYYSPLFGTSLKEPWIPGYYSSEVASKINIYDNSGEYYAQAATFLNGLESTHKAFVPFNTPSFHPYYKGTPVESLHEAEYVVLNFERLKNSEVGVPYRNCLEQLHAFGPRLNQSIVYILRYHDENCATINQ